ncbi:MAG: hypothetical protein R3281_10890 [Balneolaceae bacterium]|nr:hypothetical protein [Balneolaceae bacterium]
MWNRLLRALAALFSAYSFIANPLRYLVSLVMVIIIPYLVYVFLGGIAFGLLLVVGGYLVYRAINNSKYYGA